MMLLNDITKIYNFKGEAEGEIIGKKTVFYIT